MTDMCNCL